MAEKIGVVISKDSGREYPIYLGKDKVIYCNCWAWKKNRTCKHINAFKAQLREQVYKDPLMVLIDKEVEHLRGR